MVDIKDASKQLQNDSNLWYSNFSKTSKDTYNGMQND